MGDAHRGAPQIITTASRPSRQITVWDNPTDMSFFVFLLLPIAAAGAAHVTGITATLGAHPYWATKVIWIGCAAGLGLAWLGGRTRLPQGSTLTLSLLLMAVAFLLARAGKEGFAASYGEDAVAGQIWFFGWIATCAFAAAALATLGRPDPPKH